MTQLLPLCEEPPQQERVSIESVALPLEWYVPIMNGSAVPAPHAADLGDRLRLGIDIAAVRERAYLWTKRLFDIVGASLAIALLSPMMLIVALLIKLTDWGPVFYIHRRVGLGGKEFHCIKFRSMVVDADALKVHLDFHNHHDDSRTFKIPDDPRITWIGQVIRRSSIDELPQLFNVLLGHMSIVGPRPPVPKEVALYDREDMRRLNVKPGLTCIWQVSGRSRLAFPEQLRLDLEYIENRSLWLDLKLVALTIPAVLSADGAY